MLEQDNAKGMALKGNNYLLSTIGAILGALIGAVPWAIAYYFGWFVGWLGFLIGVCAVKGYNIFRGKSGWQAILIIIFATVLGVAAGQILGDFFDIAKYIANGELYWATYSEIPKIYFYVLVNDAEMQSSTLLNFGLGLVFAGLGIWRMIKDMITGLKGNNQNESNIEDSEQTFVESEHEKEHIEN